MNIKLHSRLGFVGLLVSPFLSAAEGFEAATEDATIQVPTGLTLKRFANEEQVLNTTALCIDDQGRVYVAETHRWRVQVQDIRGGGEFLKERIEDDITCWTTDDRIAFHKKWSGEKFLEWEYFTREAEKIRLLEDRDGDGRADRAGYFRDDFNDPLSGTSGGIMERDGTVYFANIPGIYSLRDLDGDGKAEEVKTLVDGFGVRVSFSGHDLNGFAFGPDGKIYWSVGDRGYHVEQDGKVFASADTGGVFRSNPDGSQFEVVYDRLRNPKEIVFDEFGNLFTVDNDYDQGDSERIVYLVEHGDAAWQMGHQTQTSFGNTVYKHRKPNSKELHEREDPWMAEGMWKTRHEDQPAYLLPPVALTVNGPGGLAYHPGVTSLPARYERTFFLASYVGAPATCKIEAFRLKPEGGGFAVESSEPFLKSMAVTDLDWGPEGKLYISDFIGGWVKAEAGNVWTIADESGLRKPEVLEVKELLATGITGRSPEELSELLAHADVRVRQRAQFAIAKLPEARAIFEAATSSEAPLLKRLHGIWGLGQLAFADSENLHIFAELLDDPEMEVRANAARTLGWHPEAVANYHDALVKLLQDSSPRVVSLAALALANEGSSSSVEAALAMLIVNEDRDLYVRHGGIMILTKGASATELGALASHPSKSVRIAAVVALRRQGAAEIERFFDDADLFVRKEAVRGAYDENIVEALPALAGRAQMISASISEQDKFYPLTAKRAIYAAWRLGRPEDVARILSIASDTNVDSRVRRDALVALLDWNEPPVADPVVGTAVPLPEGRSEIAARELDALKDLIASLASASGEEDLLELGLKLARQSKVVVPNGTLFEILSSTQLAKPARRLAAELFGQQETDSVALKDAMAVLLRDESADLRSYGREFLMKTDRPAALLLLGEALVSPKSTVAEKQQTLEILGKERGPSAEKALVETLKRLQEGKLAKAIVLDAILAAESSPSPEVARALASYREELSQKDPLAEWFAACEEGGDPKRGEEVYLNHGSAQCARCHVIDGVGGKVGPDLSAIGKDHSRSYLLRALITPGSEVAVGYGIGTVVLKDGSTISGLILADDEEGNAVVRVGEDERVIPKESIATPAAPVSAMPPMSGLLSKKEARDLVAYLAVRKKDDSAEKHK
ncbi:DUF7133 domain-containing protein [Roseibacillus persicicus]|uniref:DUF7133 domain-containing protein n=1 Tax=Roseibacillus persicicus TaxID=454148 RepID=UPI0028109DF7|nr:HEAT repeat domain-containing protein [Roseibacillus persicicus]